MSATISYASDLLGRLDVAAEAVGSALDGIERLSPREFRQLDERYLHELVAAQGAIRRARTAVLAPLAPSERMVVTS